MLKNSFNHSETNLQSSGEQLTRGRIVLNWMSRYAAIEIAVLLSLAVAAYFLGRHLLDTSVPAEGDVRAHIFKIEFLQSYLSHFSWPQWNPYWYEGIPANQYYPPGFYFLGAIISFIVRNGVVAYKVMLFIAMALNGLSIYYFSKRFLQFNSHLAIWCLIVYITSTPILVNFMYGEGPNLFGWSVTTFFLTVYLSQIIEDKTHRLVNIIFPGLLLGVAILIHPFPVIFAAIVIVVFNIVWLVHRKHEWRVYLRSHLPYTLAVIAIGSLVGMYYWLPAFLTLDYSSPIYSFNQFMWPGGIIYLLSIIFLALTVTVLTRYKIRGDPALDTLIITFCIACALGFGATRYLPFDLGSLVQEFRFSSIIVPFLGILLIVIPLKYKLFRLNTVTVVTALAISLFLSAFIFGLNQRESFVSGFNSLSHISFASLYQLLSKQFAANFPGFAVTIFPYFAVLLFLALSLRSKPLLTGRSRTGLVVAGCGCLMLLTSFIPYINTAKSVDISGLYNYVDNYEQPGYAQIMTSARNGRMIVPMSKGYLVEGDSPVTFGRIWGVEAGNGPYNQGDPKFFKFSVHLEWEERWLNYSWIRENLMQESASKYIFIRDSFALPSDLTGMTTGVSNSYGKILELNQNVSYADKVTPILVDVDSLRNVTEFFNILLPQGYKMVMMDVHDVPPDLLSRFKYIMVDNSTRISQYPGKTVFLLNDSISPSVTENRGIVTLNIPYLTYTNKIFYHGDPANVYMWLGWDGWPGTQITSDMQAVIRNTGNLMAPYLMKLDYTQASYNLNDTRIDLATSPGFTLVKDSYFPYWKSQNNNVMSTTQGFMLVYSNSGTVTLNYQEPPYLIFASVCSGLGLLTMIALLAIGIRKHK